MPNFFKFIYDTDFQTGVRIKLMPILNKNTLIGLQEMINEHNPYAKLFKNATSSMVTSEYDMQMIIKSDLQSLDLRRYNKPTSSDIAVVIPGDGLENVTSRNILITKHDNVVKRILELNGAYDPLMYVLLFPYGEKGFELYI